MHPTLKRQAIKPVQASCAKQRRQFDHFREENNTARPYEALDQSTPASRYAASSRAYTRRLSPIVYPGHFLVKKVSTGGTIRFQRRLLYLANALFDQPIGLEKTDDGIWRIYVNTVLIGALDERDGIVQGQPGDTLESATHVAGPLCYRSSPAVQLRVIRVIP